MATSDREEKGASAFHLGAGRDGWQVGQFDALEGLGTVGHVVTTRRGPRVASDPDCLSPTAAAIRTNLGLEAVAWCRQVHGTEVLVARQGGGIDTGDALLTDRPGLGLMGRSADCPLILVADRHGRAVGIAHASWRGTVAGIAANLLANLRLLGVGPKDCVAGICPAAGPCCYQVGPEVLDAAVEGIGPHAEEFFRREAGRLHFDLWKANATELARGGVRERDIHIAGICTICRNDLFPSYRVEGTDAGRFAAVIWLRADRGSSRGSG